MQHNNKLFAVIQYCEYTDNQFEGDIKFKPHGLSPNLESAKAFAKKLILNEKDDKDDDEYLYVVGKPDDDSDFPYKVNVENSPTAKLICVLRGYHVLKPTEDSREDVMNSMDSPVTVEMVLQHLDCDQTEIAKAGKVFPLDEVIDDNVARQFALLNFIAENCMGVSLLTSYTSSDHLFGIIEMSMV